MKKTAVTVSIVILLSIISITGVGALENRFSVGGGYFGENITYPGAVINFEWERPHTDQLSILFRSDLGFYVHPRSSTAIFLDVHVGFRRSFSSGFFLEQYFGLGAMVSFYQGDVYYVDGGTVTQISNYGNFDFVPSATFGLGWRFIQHNSSVHSVYVRPKIFWQFPVNDLASPHLALQVGYLFTFGRGE